MALITITMHWKSDDWFDKCADYLYEQFLCKPLPKEQYLRLKHVSTLLNKSTVKTLEWLSKHPTVHGFIVDQVLYVHPTRFTKMYMKKVIRTIDKGYNLERPFIN